MKLMKTASVILILILIAGFIVPPASADWVNPVGGKPTVADWTNMALNITNTWSMISINRSQITDATTVNISTAKNAAIAASSVNISALSGNGTVVMDNSTAVPWYNLTTSYSRIIAGTQSLNFTTPATGSYLVEADIRENASISTVPTAFSTYALCDATGTALVTNSERMGARLQDTANFTGVTRHFTWIYTNTTGTAQVSVCGKISSAAAGRWAVASDADGRSTMSYVRLP